MIQLNLFLYFSVNSIHYLLVTQDIDILYVVKEFLYQSELCSIALFFSAEIYKYFKVYAEILVLTLAISGVFCVFLIITTYFVIEIFLGNFNYRNCNSSELIASKVLGLVLIAVYIYLAIRISYILYTLKKSLHQRKNESNIKDLKYSLYRILVIVMFTVGTINIVEEIIQYAFGLQICNFLKIHNESEFALVLIQRFFTNIFSFSVISYIFWFSRKNDTHDFIRNLRESLDYSETMAKERFDSYGNVN